MVLTGIERRIDRSHVFPSRDSVNDTAGPEIRLYDIPEYESPGSNFDPDVDAEGLFLIELESGKISQIASYREMMEKHPC